MGVCPTGQNVKSFLKSNPEKEENVEKDDLNNSDIKIVKTKFKLSEDRRKILTTEYDKCQERLKKLREEIEILKSENN